MNTPDTEMMKLAEEISEIEARLLEAYGPLEMASLIEALVGDLAWIEIFAQTRFKDDSATFARVNRGALRTIAQKAGDAQRGSHD